MLVIGTMNTADRSIALVDQAMRRRFDFVPLFPGREPLIGMLRGWLSANAITDTAADLLDTLNALLGEPESAVGPSYFMNERSRTPAGLERIWRTSIFPLLEERFAGGDTDVHDTYSFERVSAKIKTGISASPPAPHTDDIAMEEGEPLGGDDIGEHAEEPSEDQL
jgi:5-methylcytosine-specific restriction protein B